MKRTLLLTLSLISLIAGAQESQIMGGYLLDGNDSFEELDAAVLTDDRTKDRILDGKGMRFHGASIFMTPESIGKEIGSIVRTKHPFLVKTISFTVEENRMEGSKASIRIYRMNGDDDLENIITMPIYQEIPKVSGRTTFSIAPEEIILLDPGKYYISFCLTDIGHEIKERWADSASWDEKERFAKYQQDRIFFPAYIKGSYTREKSGQPLEKWGMNIGVSVRGCNKKE